MYAKNLWELYPRWREFTSTMGSRKDYVDICFFFHWGFLLEEKRAYKIYYFLLKNSHEGDKSASRTEVSGGILNHESFSILYKKHYLISLSNKATDFASYRKRCLVQLYKIKIKIP